MGLFMTERDRKTDIETADRVDLSWLGEEIDDETANGDEVICDDWEGQRGEIDDEITGTTEQLNVPWWDRCRCKMQCIQ